MFFDEIELIAEPADPKNLFALVADVKGQMSGDSFLGEWTLEDESRAFDRELPLAAH